MDETTTYDAADDPRLDEEYVRVVDVDGTEIVLVGVVHDHPASMFRASSVTGAVDPATVALELPSLAVPMFRRFAAEESSPPSRGGEMSASIQAAPSARTVGIDAPNLHYLGRLGSKLLDESAPFATTRAVARDLWGSVRQSLRYWTAARFAMTASHAVGGESLGDVSALSHDVDPTDPPATQAEDESRQIRRHYSLLNAVERPDAVRLVDETREEAMAHKLERLSADGSVVAVVGYDHLAQIADHLGVERADAN
jgi:hypothetical protein